jgi:uncharacterized membrane protein YhaH (DUF805 family)
MAANPYTAPQSRVADIVEDAEYGTIKMWSASGRIGRLRYLAYTTGASLIVGGLSSVLTLALGPEVGMTLTLLAYIPLLVFCVLAGIQRSHDMNWSGWTILLALIPLVGLIWLFKPGSEGANEYGNPPPPNTTGVKILALLFPIIALIGIAAAIAIPAFMGTGNMEDTGMTIEE